MKCWLALGFLLFSMFVPPGQCHGLVGRLLLSSKCGYSKYHSGNSSFRALDPVNRFDADGRIGKSALNWATGIDLDSNVPLAEQIQAHRQGGAEYLWTAVPAFVDAVAGSLIGCLFTPQDLWVMEQRTMGANTPEVQAYNQLAQIVHEHVGSPLAGLGVYDSGSANAQWGRELGEMALFVGVLEGARSQIHWQPGRAGGAVARTAETKLATEVAQQTAQSAAKTGARFSRVGGAAGDFLVPGEETLQAGLRDPALYGTRLTTTPTFNAALESLGQVTGRGLNASVEIGPGAFSSRANLIQTIIHEETHIRLDLRAARGSQRAIRIQSTISAEEAYVEAVAQRYWRMYGGR